MVRRAVYGNKTRAHAVGTAALARPARHHTYLNIGLLRQAPDGTGYNLPSLRPEFEGRRSSQVGVLALLTA